MPILTACGACAFRFNAADAALGKSVICPRCQGPVPVTGHPVPDESGNYDPSQTELLRSIRLAVWINAWLLMGALILQLVAWIVSTFGRARL